VRFSIVILLCVLLSGCIGLWRGNPYETNRLNGQYNACNIKWWSYNIHKNPEKVKGQIAKRPPFRWRSAKKLWWQLDTSKMDKAKNPWNIYVRKKTLRKGESREVLWRE